ncbi:MULTISPECIES: hypothetical protein [Legionella]|uniref:Uncharacterized protein n=1 Tax=Legionella resiliens TaxID=2905958 RepID=A0ABS8WYW8_9GAMM|nr:MULTISPECIES: hypothetical protein [unclassified Legionella]MCE0722524.1 hypothetical protein [Legionella sp. 9fVS26]MCE3531678.1 hypothetical protein [Legionella sp. 8cVS16]QLZ67700.1 hypothetical protein FOLKNPGA_00473 [Legionella sp. PC1000]
MAFTRIFFLIVLISIFGIQQTQAEETDQFTLPPGELQDIGPAASYRLYEVLEKVIAQTNSEIRMLLPRAQRSRHAASQLASRRNDNYLADLVYKYTGPGFPRWLRRLPKESKPLLYKEALPWKTVYWLVFSQSPVFLIGLAPTINMYGYYFGTDKLGHFFMMGHTYYKIYMYYLDHGKSAEQAHAAIVLYGQILEQTYLGTLANGVYSNGDLSANYAGWKFYMNLGHSVKIGKRTLPPILVLNGNQWEFSKHVTRENLLKPYISDNLNEAYNPCRYSFNRNQIRRQIKKRCAQWISREGLTQQVVRAKLKETLRWHGENYGHWLPARNAVTLAACFGGK